MGSVGADPPVGREAELVIVDGFLVASGQQPAGLVVEGPAGIGKSTLVAAAIGEARRRGFQVLSARPTGVDAAWAWQSLTDLLAEVDATTLAALPPPQRQALAVALLRTPSPASSDGPAQARAISLATLTVIASMARAGPLLVTIDDAPWIDTPTAGVLAFVVRRLGNHPVGILVTRRAEAPGPAPFDLESTVATRRVWLDPLSVGAVHALLADRLGLTLPRPTLARLHDMARGNPFHALEIGRALQRLPALPRPGEPLPVPESVRDLIRAHLDLTSHATRRTLLLAAAAGSPTAEELRRANGPGTDAALEEATDRALLAVDDGVVRFSHPSFASAVYEDAAPSARRAAHRRLATAVTGSEARARHLALATITPDPAVADALETASREAKDRGAAETATELMRLAVERTPESDVGSRRRRRLLLANLLLELPDLAAAGTLTEDLVRTLPPGGDRAEARLLAGTVAWYTNPDSRVAVAHLLSALEEVDGDRELLGRLHYRLAIFHDFDNLAARRHAEAAVEALDGLGATVSLAGAMYSLFFTQVIAGEPPAAELLERALAIEGDGRDADRNTVPGIWWLAIDRPDLARARFEDMLKRSRAAGEVSGEADLLTRLAETELFADRWRLARSLADEARLTARQEGQPTGDPALRVRSLIDAHLGDLAAARSAAREGLGRAEGAGDPLMAAAFLVPLALAALSEGKWAEVEEHAAQSEGHLQAIGRVQPLRLDVTPDRIEALVALGRIDEAEGHLDRFAAGARVVPRPWADAAVARGRARVLAAHGRLEEAIAATDTATDRRSDWWRRFDRARTLLVRGELLREARARRDAGDVLGEALALFDDLGATTWAARARVELSRLGRHRPGTPGLTPTERQVAELAAAGLRNREVAHQLGISDKTVEAHLSQVYAKLSIRSRAELGRALGGAS